MTTYHFLVLGMAAWLGVRVWEKLKARRERRLAGLERAARSREIFDEQKRVHDQQRRATTRRQEPGYIDGPQAEAQLGFEGPAQVTRPAPGRMLPGAAYLPFADQHGPAVVGTDSHKAFPPRVVMTDNEICLNYGHLIAFDTGTCVRCYQVVYP